MEKEVESLGKEIVKDASSSDDNAGDKVPAKIDGKELVQLFKSMSVSKKSKLIRDPKSWRSSSKGSSLTKNSLQKCLKNRSSFVRQKKKPLVRVKLRPSKLTSVVDQLQKDHHNKQSSSSSKKKKSPDSRFSEFSADCSKALETIEKTTIIKPQSKNKQKKKIKVVVKPKLNFGNSDSGSSDDNVDKDVVGQEEKGPKSGKKPNRVQKKRKASTSCAQQARNECYNNSAEVNLSIDYLADYLEETILFPKKMSYMAELMYT